MNDAHIKLSPMKAEDWVDVRDRLPTEEENQKKDDGDPREFLVIDVWGCTDIAEFCDDKWYEYSGDESNITWKVVAWMKMPGEPSWLPAYREEWRQRYK